MASVTARGSNTRVRRHGFAESNPRIRIELQKTKVQLERELERLEKQSKAETNNIATHQQALKMNFRRLEQKRKQESPTTERSRRGDRDEAGRRGIFYSKTPMAVEATAAIYSGNGRSPAEPPRRGSLTGNAPDPPRRVSLTVTGSDEALSSNGSDQSLEFHMAVDSESSLLPNTNSLSHFGHNTLKAKVNSSPYVSSPFNFRRSSKPLKAPMVSSSSPHIEQTKSRLSYPLETMTAASNKTKQPKRKTLSVDEDALTINRLESKVQSLDIGSTPALQSSPLRKRSLLKLPPLQSQGTQSEVLVAHSNTTDKETLLKAADMMKSSAVSHGPKAFQQFYSALDSRTRPQSKAELSSKILLSPSVDLERSLGHERTEDTYKPTEEKEANEEEVEEAEEVLTIIICDIHHYNYFCGQ